MAFDQAEYIKKQNEAEAAARAGKSPEPGQPPAKDPVSSVATPPAGDDDDDDRKGKHDPGRSQRRTENRLREQAAEERGRRQQLEELIAKGETFLGMAHETATHGTEHENAKELADKQAEQARLTQASDQLHQQQMRENQPEPTGAK